MFGTAHSDVQRSITETIGPYEGCFCPKEHLCPADYMTGIVRGTQKVLMLSMKRNKTHPKNRWFAGRCLFPVVYGLKSVLAYIPKRWYRTGDKKGMLILEDIEFIYEVFAVVEPALFYKFEKEQWDKYNKDLQSKDPNQIKIPKFLREKMKHQQRVYRLKGKMGRIIANKEKTVRIKRKREELLMEEMGQSHIDDQVFLPEDDM